MERPLGERLALKVRTEAPRAPSPPKVQEARTAARDAV